MELVGRYMGGVEGVLEGNVIRFSLLGYPWTVERREPNREEKIIDMPHVWTLKDASGCTVNLVKFGGEAEAAFIAACRWVWNHV